MAREVRIHAINVRSAAIIVRIAPRLGSAVVITSTETSSVVAKSTSCFCRWPRSHRSPEGLAHSTHPAAQRADPLPDRCNRGGAEGQWLMVAAPTGVIQVR